MVLLNMMKQKDIQHLYWRAGFGINARDLNRLKHKSKTEIVNALFHKSSTSTDLELDLSEFKNYTVANFKKDATLREKLNQLSAKKVKDYNKAWIERMMNPNELLREKMTLFWANHFVCLNRIIFFVQNYNNTLRSNALGNFGDFTKAISKQAAMIVYLNTKQNLKEKPNENFSRELLELFTLGVGNYSEMDIKQVARAFTGYNNKPRGDFWFRKQFHDYGLKTIFGHSGYFSGDDVIDIILEQKQCARFICRKIYSFFVNDTIDEERVEELATVFYKDYNIETVMQYLFMSDWFYNEEYIGTKVKSPIELLVGITTSVPLEFEKNIDLLKIQKLLGQILLNPPNVAGWKGGRSWIDNNTIMLRLKLPSILLANGNISTKEKGQFEDHFRRYYSKTNKNKFVEVEVNWESFDKNYTNSSFDELRHQLIVPELSHGAETYLNALSQTSKRDFCVQLMSLPEYQMC